ncbi:DegT/DnrJ/EryC1/StrS family aminotransferase [Echinicola marina]|uniref:DegT/DnrJ/EryC1/StrS family aminotransferase n=1 Tax=Echinicola marina TaxID=2859768 RepID=UPI001CF717AF|nr:DegT/DnrJ/EryC1/StrS family aminotransferase [Echinicola marina]UCS93058.1 DegT/DnrJ/EryC1/StrS family aminotransferase [Echinicola marina]
MKKSIPFLELAAMHADLADELQSKFAHMLQKGVFSGGDEIAELERSLAVYLKSRHAIACSNGTDALELALRALEIGPGDEVIVPALTWVSTAEVVKMVGAEIVFCDVDSNGLINIDQMESMITKRTKAVIPVHLYGKMVNMDRLLSITKPKGIKVVEDAAQALGAFKQGKSAGAFGDIGCFSFYPTKNLGALGEAGLLITADDFLDRKLRLLLTHGQPERDVHELIGRNSRIDTLQAGFLNVKLDYFLPWQQKRKLLAGIYLEHLQHIRGISMPKGILKEDHNAHLFTIKLEERDKLKGYLFDRGIGTAIHYPLPVPATPVFSDNGDFPIANKIASTTLSLPLHPYLGEREVRLVCEGIQGFFRS